jgi:hypothetical protein
VFLDEPRISDSSASGEDEIETVRTIEKAARIHYRALGGPFARAADGPAIALERRSRGAAKGPGREPGRSIKKNRQFLAKPAGT